MLYNSKRSAVIPEESKYLSAGINENVTLSGVRFETSPNKGNLFVEFLFKKGNKTATHTEYEPKRSEQDTDESYFNKCDNQFERVKQILECFYTPEELEFQGNSFEELAKWWLQKLENVDKSKLLRVKFILNYNDFLSLPQYKKWRFIEPMVLPEGKKSKIEIISNIDKIVPATTNVQADKETVKTDGFSAIDGTLDTTKEDPNQLPF